MQSGLNYVTQKPWRSCCDSHFADEETEGQLCPRCTARGGQASRPESKSRPTRALGRLRVHTPLITNCQKIQCLTCSIKDQAKFRAHWELWRCPRTLRWPQARAFRGPTTIRPVRRPHVSAGIVRERFYQVWHYFCTSEEQCHTSHCSRARCRNRKHFLWRRRVKSKKLQVLKKKKN